MWASLAKGSERRFLETVPSGSPSGGWQGKPTTTTTSNPCNLVTCGRGSQHENAKGFLQGSGGGSRNGGFKMTRQHHKITTGSSVHHDTAVVARRAWRGACHRAEGRGQATRIPGLTRSTRVGRDEVRVLSLVHTPPPHTECTSWDLLLPLLRHGRRTGTQVSKPGSSPAGARRETSGISPIIIFFSRQGVGRRGT